MDFFNKLEKKAAETFQKTKEKFSTVSGELKAKSKIGDYKLEIEDLYIEIGKKVFDEISSGNDVSREDILEKIEKIKSLKEDIEKVQVEILNLKKLKKCAKCGAEIDVSNEYCSKCGEKQDVTSVNVEFHESDTSNAQEAEILEVKDIENESHEENSNTESNENN